MGQQHQPLHFVYDRFYEDRFVPNGLPSRGPFWQRFVNREAEYGTDYCRTPLLTLLDAEQIPYQQSLLSQIKGNHRGPLFYLTEMLYSHAVWLKQSSGKSFVLNPFSQISEPALELIRHRRMKLVITHLKRPERDNHQWDLFSRLADRLVEFQIPFEQVCFLGCNENLLEHFEESKLNRPELDRFGAVLKIPYFERGWYHHWEAYRQKGMIYSLPEALSEQLRLRPRKFLCFNREPRAHRLVVAGWLWQNRLLDQGFISFPRAEGELKVDKFDSYREGIRDLFKDPRWIEAGTTGFEEFMQGAPYHIDHSDLENLHISWCTKSPFRDTYFSLLTERLYQSKSGQGLLTSKAFKAMGNMHPFVMVGPHRSLQCLREMGYRTFSPWFDESYDQESDNDKRMGLVLREVQRLLQYSLLDWQKISLEMQEILVFNYRHLTVRQNISLLDFLGPVFKNQQASPLEAGVNP